MGIEFNKCCFCIDLRTGCLIIGYFNLIMDIILIMLSIVTLAAAGELTAHSKDDEVKILGAGMFAIAAIMLVAVIMCLVFNIILLVGLHQYKRGHVKAFLIFTTIFTVISIITFFSNFAVGNVTAGGVFRDLASTLLTIYFILVIRSYYLKMDDPALKPAIYSTA